MVIGSWSECLDNRIHCIPYLVSAQQIKYIILIFAVVYSVHCSMYCVVYMYNMPIVRFTYIYNVQHVKCVMYVVSYVVYTLVIHLDDTISRNTYIR